MAFNAGELRSLFKTYEFKVSFFPAKKWLTDMWSFMIEDIDARTGDSGIILRLTFPRENTIEEFLDAWLKAPSDEESIKGGPRDIVIIGRSSEENPPVVRIARFSSAYPLIDSSVLTDNSLSACFACESVEEDFRGYTGQAGGAE